jgi:putative DNA primase/helicase
MHSDFRDALAAHGVPVPTQKLAEGHFTRWGEKSRYYAKPLGDGVVFGDFVDGMKGAWFPDNGRVLSAEERRERDRSIAVARAEEAGERTEAWRAKAGEAQALWDGCAADGTSPYLARKHVSAYGVRFEGETLVVPLRDAEGKLWSVQRILPDGTKWFLSGGRTRGLFHCIGNLERAERVLVAEGYATGASLYMATGLPVVVAFNAGNLEPVTAAIKQAFPALRIVIAGDNDHAKEPNTGKEKAEAAARTHNCKVVLPTFPEGITGTDWNDLHALSGLEEIQRQIGAVLDMPQVETLEAAMSRLSTLLPLTYEQCREAEAKALGVRVSVLDQEIKLRRAQSESGADKGLFPTIDPWPEPVRGDRLLDEIAATLRRFIICEPETITAATLWCAFTWLIDAFDVAPLAIITAPEMRCGKSQLLDVMRRLSCRPLTASNLSSSVVFRVIEKYHPTLLIDEADSFFKENEELRGVINSGHTRSSAYVLRNVGDAHEPQRFSTWGAKAICGIGHLPATVMDRGIILELRRKLPSEQVERLRHAEPGLFERLSSMLAWFADDAAVTIKAMRPELPDALHDRAQDNWEPLLAIADYAGGNWPQLARQAALAISGIEQETLSLSVELLADIQEVFMTKGVERLSTKELLEALTEDDLKSWATHNRGKPITPRQMAKRLGEYGIKSKTIRMSYGTAKGFCLSDCRDAFARYLPSSGTPLLSVTPSQMEEKSILANGCAVTDSVSCAVTAIPSVTLEPAESLTCYAVTDKIPSGRERVEVLI